MSALSTMAFTKTLFAPSDVQIAHTLSPDGRELSILLTGLELRLNGTGSSPQIQQRTTGFGVGLGHADGPLRVRVHLRGSWHPTEGVAGAACVTAGTTTELVDLAAGKDSAWTHELVREVQPGAGLPVALALVLTRDLDRPDAAAILTIDSVDLAIEAGS